MHVMIPDIHDEPAPSARTTDPEPSHAGGRDVRLRAGSQRANILLAYAAAGADGLTARQAGTQGAPHALCAWKRTSELAAADLIGDTGERRRDGSGSAQTVYAITTRGTMVAARLTAEGTDNE